MKENQRVRLSKMLLQNSLLELLSEKRIHEISVRELCDHANINRTTFYKYYSNQYDLQKEMEDQILKQIDDFLKLDKKVDNDEVQALIKTIEYIQDNLKFCRLLINNTMDKAFPERLFNLSNIRFLMDEKLGGKYKKDELEYAYQFVFNGGFSIIKHWINKDNRESSEKIANTLVNIIHHVFV